MSLLEVHEIDGVRFKKYVLVNSFTGIVIDRRFWTISGARRQADKTLRSMNKTMRAINKRQRKV